MILAFIAFVSIRKDITILSWFSYLIQALLMNATVGYLAFFLTNSKIHQIFRMIENKAQIIHDHNLQILSGNDCIYLPYAHHYKPRILGPLFLV